MVKNRKNKIGKLIDDKVFLAVCAFFLALLVLTVILLLIGYSPIECYSSLFRGAFVGKGNLANTLGTSTPLIFAGLSMMVASRSGTFNIGIEGQIIAGAFASAIVGTSFAGLPRIIYIPLCFLVAMLVGGLWGALVALLKRVLQVSEIIIAIMLNYIMDYLTKYLLTYHFTVDGMVIRTEYLPESALLHKMLPLSRLNTGIILAVITVAFVWWLINKTTFGYEMRATGYNPFAAESAGISMRYMPLAAMFISGAIAGMAGAIEVMGVHEYFVADMTAGYGFTGVAIGIMGGGSAVGTLISALVFGSLRAGSATMNRMVSIPGEFIQIFQALVIVFVSTPGIVRSILSRKKQPSWKLRRKTDE